MLQRNIYRAAAGSIDNIQAEGTAISTLATHPGWRNAIRRNPAFSAWPFVVVILAQMAVGGFSVYTQSAIRSFVTGESLWSTRQHEAIYYLSLYIDTENPHHLASFEHAIATPLAYRRGRDLIERKPPDAEGATEAFIEGGNEPADLPPVIWMFRHFRGFPYLEAAITRWKETDPLILELRGLGASLAAERPMRDVAASRDRLEQINAAITPRTIAFSSALGEGARVVEWMLMLANLALAGVLVVLTIWRVGRFLKQRRQIEGELAWQASHDDLTGLVNRRAFEEHLARARVSRKSGAPSPCALMFIDLDQFKIINDTCGHASGDALLRRIGPALQSALGSTDFLGRLGGDEFSIFLPRTDMARALAMAESLRAAVERIEFLWNGRPFGVTASIGLVQDDTGVVSPDDMMRAADMACFMAKEKGRNRVHAHCDEDMDLIGRVREMNWVQRIHQGLNEDRFCLHAQEIVALAGDEDPGIHIELLIRMHDETGLLVPPSSFLPAAERFGLVGLIDRWVVRTAFAILAERRKIGTATPVTCCAINLSGATIGDQSFLGFLKEAFVEFRIAPSTICFEVTETSAIVNLEAARGFIRDLRRLGCTFALDDFGSGMSSFNYLKELPVDFLKIDGAFVKNLLTDRADRAMVEMINHVGHVMGKRIVAEFVETQDLADALRDIGVDYGQGFGIAQPKPFDVHFESMTKEVAARPHFDLERRSA